MQVIHTDKQCDTPAVQDHPSADGEGRPFQPTHPRRLPVLLEGRPTLHTGTGRSFMIFPSQIFLLLFSIALHSRLIIHSHSLPASRAFGNPCIIHTCFFWETTSFHLPLLYQPKSSASPASSFLLQNSFIHSVHIA